MFSGIIQTVGSLTESIKHTDDRTLIFKAPRSFLSGVCVGDSIAVSGACLTVTAHGGDTFSVDVSAETLACTYFSELVKTRKVNLEKTLTLQTLLNGHLVTGHVDGIGKIRSKTGIGRSKVLEIEVPKNLMRYMAEKGSVSLDGVSLTINNLSKFGIMVNCIPHTLTQTILGAWQVGSKVHIEVDIIARYLERLIKK